jgi:hypothetical protein
VRRGDKEEAAAAAAVWGGVEVEVEVGATGPGRIPTSPRLGLACGAGGTGDAPMWGGRWGCGSREACRAWLAGFITAGDGRGRTGPGTGAANQSIQTGDRVCSGTLSRHSSRLMCQATPSNQRFGRVLFNGTKQISHGSPSFFIHSFIHESWLMQSGLRIFFLAN